jgi:hypothetical protein
MRGRLHQPIAFILKHSSPSPEIASGFLQVNSSFVAQ